MPDSTPRTIVKKFGGSSVATVEHIQAVADQAVAAHHAGERVVVVVSAMGKTTDELFTLAQRVAPTPDKRELDMLLTAGERISMSLLAIAIRARGVPATSLTGSQAGILTNHAPGGARIVEVRPYRVEDALAEGHVVIVAGYQGVSYRREVTTLGRGGSDTTAVALAAALGAAACEIYSDIDGVYTGDPKRIVDARRLAEASCEEMIELARAGAKVLGEDAIAFAQMRGIALFVRASDGRRGETLVRKDGPDDHPRISGVACRPGACLMRWIGHDEARARLETTLLAAGVAPLASSFSAAPLEGDPDRREGWLWLARDVADAVDQAWTCLLDDLERQLGDGHSTRFDGTLVSIVGTRVGRDVTLGGRFGALVAERAGPGAPILAHGLSLSALVDDTVAVELEGALHATFVLRGP